MPPVVISVEHLSKAYRLGQIGSGTLADDLKAQWARMRGKPNPLLKVGQSDDGNRQGELIWALRDISFQVEQGEVLGIIGRNGAGKSTLLKILSRVTVQTEGRVKVNGRIASLLEVGTGFHPDLTGRENIYLNGAILGMRKEEVRRKFDEIVAFSEIEQFIDTPVKRYSSGMYVRLAFAVAAHLEPEILLIDEVLAVGDIAFQKKCIGKMGDASKHGRTVLFVSHNMSALEHLCSRGIVLISGQKKMTGEIKTSIEYYLSTMLNDKTRIYDQPHVIYENNHLDNNYQITKIEILNKDNEPKPIVYTWDDIRLKIHYYAKQTVVYGAIFLKICDRYGNSLLFLSTQPDSKVPMTIKEGHHSGICEISQVPLAAGDYVIGCGLAIPNKELLCWDENLTMLTIHSSDVYESGLAPNSARSLIATPHKWIIE